MCVASPRPPTTSSCKTEVSKHSDTNTISFNVKYKFTFSTLTVSMSFSLIFSQCLSRLNVQLRFVQRRCAANLSKTPFKISAKNNWKKMTCNNAISCTMHITTYRFAVVCKHMFQISDQKISILGKALRNTLQLGRSFISSEQ